MYFVTTRLLHILISRETFNHALFVIGATPDPKLLNIRNCHSLTPLHLAVLEHEPLLCRRLLLADASLRIQNAEGNTALHLACKSGDYYCAKALTEPLTQIEVMWLDKNGKKINRSRADFEIHNHEGKHRYLLQLSL